MRFCTLIEKMSHKRGAIHAIVRAYTFTENGVLGWVLFTLLCVSVILTERMCYKTCYSRYCAFLATFYYGEWVYEWVLFTLLCVSVD